MTANSSLISIAEQLSNSRMLCVGDLMLDCFVSGEVSRISPEAPIPVLRTLHERTVLGGAGNVVRNIRGLGGKVTLVGAVGNDARGIQLAEMLRELEEVQVSLVTDPRRKTTFKTRFLGGNQQLLRVDDESDAPLSHALEDEVIEAVRRSANHVNAIILSDYGKGVLSNRVTREIIAIAREAGCPVFVDPKGTDYTRYKDAFVITPNLKELSEATGMPVHGDEAVVAAAMRLNELCGTYAILVTRSKDGMSLVAANGRALHLPANAREVFDVSGAGDTVISTFATAHAVGATLEDAANLANVAAQIVVGKVGTAAVYRRNLVETLHAEELTRAEAKIVHLTTAIERVEAWRRKGLRVGFTNGCFDLLHPGHLSLFNQAAARCDRLIVGLNSDASVRRLKGPGRPVQNEAARSAVLASMDNIDMVIIFDQDTPHDLLVALRPDVLVKGADYRRDEVVGADLVTSYGGKIFLARLESGHSTSRTIARIASIGELR